MSDKDKPIQLSAVATEPNPNAIACLESLLKLAKDGVVIGIYGCVISPGEVVQPESYRHEHHRPLKPHAQRAPARDDRRRVRRA